MFNVLKKDKAEYPVFADYNKCRPVETDDNVEYYQTEEEIPNIKMSDILHVRWLTYQRREGVPDASPLLYHYEDATFEEMMKRNGELDNQ